MLVFVYEYACAVDGPGLPAALRAEGRAMLTAVVRDFEALPGVATCTLLSSADRGADVGSSRPHRHEGDEAAVFRRLAAAAAWTVVIAPETDGLLEARCRGALDAGGRLLGPAPEAVRLTGDKLALARHLQGRGLPTPRTVLAGKEHAPAFPAVCKPRYGAGSQATFLVHGPDDLADCLARAHDEAAGGDLVLQPFVPGLAAGAAVLAGGGGVEVLPPAEQALSADGRFHYLGGRVPVAPPLALRAAALARRAVAAVDGLTGYVGVDLVLGAAPDGRADQVIEINPRLTTSYVGLRRLARGNLAGAMLRAASGLAPGPLAWRAGVVRFRADGELEEAG